MASREENEAVAGLLRRSLARDAAIAGDCPEPEFLAAYFEHSLAAAETERYDRHFSGCSRCREQLAAMVRAEVPKPQSRSAWLLDWRLLSAAAVVMVVVTVWLAIRKPGNVATVSQPANAPLVASKTEEPKPTSTVTTEADRITAVPKATPEDDKNLKLAPTAPAALPPAREEAREDKAKAAQQFADSNSLEIESAPKGAQPAAPLNQHALAQVSRLKQQASVSSHQAAAGGSLGQGTATGHAAGALQQIPSASQMVMVVPSPPQAQSAPAKPESVPATGQNVSGASAPVPTPAASTENMTVTSGEIANDKRPDSQPLSSAYPLNSRGATLQVLAESSVAKVIDTPIPSIKWRITATGFVERSEDGGATWKGQEPDPEAHLVAGSAPTSKVCWLVGSEGIVLVTKDATNWKKIPAPVTADLTAVSAKSASDATITTSDGRRFSTHNEGKKWKPEN